MGEDCGSWFPQQYLNRQSPNLHSCNVPLDLGQQDTVPLDLNLGSNMVSANWNVSPHVYSELPQPNTVQPSETRGWFYCLPRFRQALMPATENILKEKLPSGPRENCGEAATRDVGPGRKKFLVFDHSGDQTTLIFSSGIQTPIPCPTSWGAKPPGSYNMNLRVLGAKTVLNHLSRPILTDDFDENYKIDMQSEMHEDTEELNALLYSDDESDSSEDDEVTSTGHSPSTMTANDHDNWFYGSNEEVDSSVGSTKKRKSIEGGFENAPSVANTAYFTKPNRSYQHEDDAESCCGIGKNPGSNQLGSSGNKRMCMDKIRETVKVLQKIIPDGEGKDAVMVLDEAILYLKSLKIKAKALGLGSL